jgi:hypothetical protein
MKMKILIITCVLLSIQFTLQEDETVSAVIYADNWFEFYVNGVKVKTDPLDFTPHNAVKFTFTVPKTGKRVYAVKASDFATQSGYEYTSTSQPQLGDGALRINFSDGTISNTNWKCMTTSFGPTDASNSAGCSSTNLSACKIQLTDEPANWYSSTFDDSKWQSATTYTDQEAGWGMTPSYSNGQCGRLTDPLTRGDKNPNTKTTTEDECQDPKKQSWGKSQFIWQPDLKRDNTILCRYSFTPGTTTATSTTSSNTPSGSNGDYLQISILLLIFVTLLF